MIAYSEVLLQNCLVSANALDGQNASRDLRDGGVAVGRCEPTGVANLPAGIAVETGVIEDDFDLIAGFGRGHTCAVFHEGEDFGVVGGVDQQCFSGRGTCHQVGVVVHGAYRRLQDGGAGQGPEGGRPRVDVSGVVVLHDSHSGYVTGPRSLVGMGT